MRYFKRRWDETRADEHDEWGASWWYFEVDPDGYPTRQVVAYEKGPTFRYDQEHLDDDFGSLGDQPLDEAEFAPFAIPAAEFDSAWDRAGAK